MSAIKKRLDRLQPKGEYKDVLALIKAKKCYSELTDQQKERYWQYHKTTREAAEGVTCMVLDITPEELDFVLEKIPPPEPMEKIAKEIEELVFSETFSEKDIDKTAKMGYNNNGEHR